MAEITRRRTGEFLRKLFEILLSHPDGLQARDALRSVREAIPLSDYEKGNVESGGNRFEKIVRFATVDCVKAGWLVKNHGIWTVTDAGEDAFIKVKDPEAFAKKAYQLYNLWRKSKPADDSSIALMEPEADIKAASITYEEADEQAWLEIERHLEVMPPFDFQELVAALLRVMGYHVGWVAPPGKDGGVDIIAFSDPLGTRPPRIKVQVKRQQQKINVDGLRSFMAVLSQDDVGIFVNAGGFTKDAEDEARAQPSRRVTLVDLKRLVELWKEHYDQVDESSRWRLPLRPIFFLAPDV